MCYSFLLIFQGEGMRFLLFTFLFFNFPLSAKKIPTLPLSCPTEDTPLYFENIKVIGERSSLLIDKIDANLYSIIRSIKVTGGVKSKDLEILRQIARENYRLHRALFQIIYSCRSLLKNKNIAKNKPYIASSVFLARLIQNDLYLSFLQLSEGSSFLRKIFNIKTSHVPKRMLRRLNREFYHPRNRRDLERGLPLFRQHLIQNEIFTLNEKKEMRSYLATSPTYSFLTKKKISIRAFRHLSHMKNELKLFHHEGVDHSEKFIRLFKAKFSKVFGLTVGKIKWRSGKMKNRDDLLKEIKEVLRPLDILIERTEKVSKHFMPGHFGHAALYLGTKEQLITLGLWDKPFVKKFRKKIGKGNVVLESKKQGVILSSLEDFINVDDLALLRLKKDDRHEVNFVEKKVQEALHYYGKKYDFEFDTEDDNSLYCSELIYHLFKGIHFPQSYNLLLGQSVLLPDNIAQEALKENSALEIVKLYLDGQRANIEEMEFLPINE